MKRLSLVFCSFFHLSTAMAAGSVASINCLDSKTSGDLQIFLQATSSGAKLAYTWGYMNSGRQDGHLTLDKTENGKMYFSDHYEGVIPNLRLEPTAQKGLYNGYISGQLSSDHLEQVSNYQLACVVQ